MILEFILVHSYYSQRKGINQPEPAPMAGPNDPLEVQDGIPCRVVAGTHAGKSGTIRDVKTSKTGHVTITVEQENGERLKTLARNVVVLADKGT